MAFELFDLAGQVAIVTGSSRGIGRAIAERLAEHGARVVVSSRGAEACDAVAAVLNDRHGPGTAIAIPANISSKEALETLVSETRRQLGPLSILVCNAASNPHYGPMSGITDAQLRKVLENNVVSNHWLVQMVAPGMAERGDGAIVVVSSIAGIRGTNTIGAYGISKAADMQLVRNLAVELGPLGIRVNCVAPGVIRTDFSRALWEDPTLTARSQERTPLRRFGDPDDVAGIVVCLVSPAARYLTGQTIVIDGGDTIA
jgi:NAD(P)-dependent dehydrogenase (short-subunit alcohol dehydrogenase family)